MGKVVEFDTGVKRIALTVERMRAYGRNFCEGVAAYAQERRSDWTLEFVDSHAAGSRGGYAGFDGVIARVLDDRMAGRGVNLPRRGVVTVPPKDIVVRASTEVYSYDPPWISDALVFIRQNIARSVCAADVFAHLGLSHTTVDRTFRTVLGSTVQHEIMKARVEEAQHLLERTNLTASEIGVRCGFASNQYFCRSFTAFAGCPPLAYRGKKGKAK